MRINLSKKLKNDKQGKTYVTNLSIDSPRIYDHDFGKETTSYVIFHDCEILISFIKNEEESLINKVIINNFNVLYVHSWNYQSLESENKKSKSSSKRVSLSSIILSKAGSRTTFHIYLKPNDYSNFLLGLNSSEILRAHFSLYKEDEAKLKELAKLSLDPKTTGAKLIKFGNQVDIGRTLLRFF